MYRPSIGLVSKSIKEAGNVGRILWKGNDCQFEKKWKYLIFLSKTKENLRGMCSIFALCGHVILWFLFQWEISETFCLSIVSNSRCSLRIVVSLLHSKHLAIVNVYVEISEIAIFFRYILTYGNTVWI